MAWGSAPAAAQPEQPGLAAFSSERALRQFLEQVVEQQRQENVENFGGPVPPPPPPAAPPPPPPPPPAAGAAAAPAPLNITNNQIAGVDEGGIVKLHGDTLVILRRGRLFTVSLGDRSMRSISMIDAFPPGVDGRGDWYDEMLIAGDRVVVIGYSYARGGTQVNRFRIDAAGRLSFEDSYQLRSNDYYSSRNYASRLVGTRLIYYSPLHIPLQEPLEALPAMRRWQPGPGGGDFRRVASASRVFVPNALRDPRVARLNTLHSVTSCDLAAAVLDCEATVVIGSSSRTFFVSQNAIYLWVSDAWKESRSGADAFIYRIPFDGARPSAVQARGMPIDQFSFLPDAARSALHVLVRAHGGGDAMWRPEVTSGDMALLSVPMSAFGTGAREVSLDRYQPLPKPHGTEWNIQNRFVGDHLLYAGGSAGSGRGVATVVSLADRSVAELEIPHGIDRIDAIGPDGIVIGGGENALGFTAIELPDGGARAGSTFLLPNAREGETRSHAFFYRPDPGSVDGGEGLLGLPVAKFMQEAGRPYLGESAGILFLARRGGRLAPAGELGASTSAGTAEEDGCVASCVDWYGNARPIFLGERLFALLGYELVEGAERRGQVSEVGRTSFAPPVAGGERE